MYRLTKCFFGLLAVLVALPDYGMASDSDEYDASDEAERRYYILQRLNLAHSQEVFDYCVGRYGSDSRHLAGCMQRQEKIRKNILDQAQNELGLRSRAEKLYFECRDYYPDQGSGRIGDCVEARLILHERLGLDVVEAEIYRRCDAKWRKHSAGAVKNCVIHSANDYLQRGEIRD